MYGERRLPTGVITEIIVNPQQLPILNGGGPPSTDKQPAYFINGATDAINSIISKKMNKTQINAFLETYRRMIATQTKTPFVPTVLDSSITGLSTNQKDGKLAITTRSAEGPVGKSEITIQ